MVIWRSGNWSLPRLSLTKMVLKPKISTVQWSDRSANNGSNVRRASEPAKAKQTPEKNVLRFKKPCRPTLTASKSYITLTILRTYAAISVSLRRECELGRERKREKKKEERDKERGERK